jgi:hypothetical protein
MSSGRLTARNYADQKERRGGGDLAEPAVMSRSWRLGLPLLILLVACGGDDGGELDGQTDSGDKEDRGGARPYFYEVDASHSSASFRDYVGRAVRLLEKDESEVAQLTARAIRDGKVQIDELVDLTCWDFERVRKEVSTPLTSADYARLRQPGSSVGRALTSELDGYMWSNRIYVSRGQTTRRLAATLVHEVNHVINRSEVGYWDDLPASAFLHEYRAFHAERMFDPEEYEGIDLVAHVLELYELDRAAMPASVLAHPLSPALLPDAAAWSARRVADDVPDVEADCPAYAR